MVQVRVLRVLPAGGSTGWPGSRLRSSRSNLYTRQVTPCTWFLKVFFLLNFFRVKDLHNVRKSIFRCSYVLNILILIMAKDICKKDLKSNQKRCKKRMYCNDRYWIVFSLILFTLSPLRTRNMLIPVIGQV